MSTELTRSTSLFLKGLARLSCLADTFNLLKYNKSDCDFVSPRLRVLLNTLHFYEILH